MGMPSGEVQQRAFAHTLARHDTKQSIYIGRDGSQSEHPFSRLVWTIARFAQQQHRWRWQQLLAKQQVRIVGIESDEPTLHVSRKSQHLLVGNARMSLCNRKYIYTCRT